MLKTTTENKDKNFKAVDKRIIPALKALSIASTKILDVAKDLVKLETWGGK